MTNRKLLSVADLKRLRNEYNSGNDFGDWSWMHELFHGLDGIIDTLQEKKMEITGIALVEDKIEDILFDYCCLEGKKGDLVLREIMNVINEKMVSKDD